MVKKNKVKQEDLEHIITTSIADEGYEIDSDLEREITRLAKFVLSHEDEDEEELFEEEDLFEEDLFDDYGDEDDDDLIEEEDEI